MKEQTNMKDIITLCKEKWIVYAWSEIYWGLANSWDYGPIWSLLKENIKNEWIKEFIQKEKNMMLQDSAILMNPKVWEASWHVGWFSDPLMDCKSCKTRHRADKLIEEHYFAIWLDDVADWMTKEEMQLYIKDQKIACPNCRESNFSEIKEFNLMFKTFQWVTEDSASTVFMRPETAQWIFVNFANILRTSRKKLPFWVWQIWKAFRNEITPGNFIFRTREFEQMEIEYFVDPKTANEEHNTLKNKCMSFLNENMWISSENVRFREHSEKELAHYADACTDIEFKFPMWWWELWWIANRTDHDLKQHMEHSKQDLTYFDTTNNKKILPYVIEPSVWLTRLFLAVIANAYTVEEDRTYLKLKAEIAPIKFWIIPVKKKDSKFADEIYDKLSNTFQCEYEDTWKIWKRFQRFDEIWTPFCITVDEEWFNNWVVKIRERDTKEQVTIKISDILQMKEMSDFQMLFEK